MASIRNVRLEIKRDQGSAAARVSYTVSGDQQDVEHRHAYREIVELIGDDETPGEDGQNDLIPVGLVFSGRVKFANTAAIHRSRVLQLPSDALDEDSSANPHTILLSGDEIRARVTLAQSPPKPVRANSNLVLVGAPLLVVPHG